MNIVFLDGDTLPAHTRLRPPAFAHQWVQHGKTLPEEVTKRVVDADVLVVNKVRLDAQSLSAAPHLRLIAVAATGTNHIDLEACRRRGIVVSNIRNYAAHTVPEHTLALLFALRRSVCAYRDAVRAGRWQAAGQFCFFDHPIRDLAGSTLGVIGDGVLGQAVARLGEALGMRVLMSGHKGRQGQGTLYTPFEEVLARSDVLTLHCPLTPQTRHMIGAPEFAQMARSPLLINTARGGLVDESAVGPALDAGQIAGAAFDVTEQEPPPADHPFMALLDRPNFILTPHVAWASQEATQALADQLIDNIEAFQRGAPVNVV
ncbi:D-2-hydroxyacid dehydrogenase [Ideonella paludis]|uniref:D-2-hydroxyacid dehydrogenase n=1 Tax=Ideonella paludis TaxID=1233411 RepID=A0ABS5DSY1_9BURK|nr:D-2-hydroxyacid dehydrogenase [Ideonella paludis]MBQ0934258.1 D-2-hydroxyacid dehydrogenase [Ideonella paludis]